MKRKKLPHDGMALVTGLVVIILLGVILRVGNAIARKGRIPSEDTEKTESLLIERLTRWTEKGCPGDTIVEMKIVRKEWSAGVGPLVDENYPLLHEIGKMCGEIVSLRDEPKERLDFQLLRLNGRIAALAKEDDGTHAAELRLLQRERELLKGERDGRGTAEVDALLSEVEEEEQCIEEVPGWYVNAVVTLSDGRKGVFDYAIDETGRIALLTGRYTNDNADSCSK